MSQSLHYVEGLWIMGANTRLIPDRTAGKIDDGENTEKCLDWRLKSSAFMRDLPSAA